MENNKLNSFPFYRWMPRPLGILILMLLFVPPTFSGGAYLGNQNEMSGTLALMAEDIQLASFFTSIGMCLFVPFMIRFLQTRSVRRTYLWCFGLLVPLNYICAVTTSLPVLLAACLLTGLVRVAAMLNCTFTIAPYLTGVNTLSMFTLAETPAPETQYRMERTRTFLMPVLYCFILLIAQTSNIVTAWFAYRYNWQDAYYVTLGMLLAAVLLVLLTMPDIRNNEKYHIEWNKIPEMISMTVALCCMAYILVFGKSLDWFDSRQITVATAVLLLSAGIFVLSASSNGDRAYLPLDVFRYRNTWISMALFVTAMVFNSANSFAAAFLRISTSTDSYHCTLLSWWATAGCLAGLALSIILVVKKVRFRSIFVIALLFMAFSNCLMYFQYQTAGMFENMILPTVLNFVGLLMLYSLVAAFGMKGLPARYLATFVFLMIWMRNSIAPVIGASVYSNWLNERQQYHISVLSENVTPTDPAAAYTRSQNVFIAKASGKSPCESEQFAAITMKGKVMLQATIVAMKEITGDTVVLILIAAGITFILPYRRGETT